MKRHTVKGFIGYVCGDKLTLPKIWSYGGKKCYFVSMQVNACSTY
jgi:hypothetical protein